MKGVHDMGGMECFGELELSDTDVHFHHDWEKRVLALCLAMGASGPWNLDKSRSARESLPPSYYLSAGYFRIWFAALENLLLEFSLVSTDELATGTVIDESAKLSVLKASAVPAALLAGSPVERTMPDKPLYQVGERVKVSRTVSKLHTRCPDYVRGCVGVVHLVHGGHVYPDSHAQMQGENPQWLYNIQFNADELWGESRSQAGTVHVDLWQPYLENMEAQ